MPHVKQKDKQSTVVIASLLQDQQLVFYDTMMYNVKNELEKYHVWHTM